MPSERSDGSAIPEDLENRLSGEYSWLKSWPSTICSRRLDLVRTLDPEIADRHRSASPHRGVMTSPGSHPARAREDSDRGRDSGAYDPRSALRGLAAARAAAIASAVFSELILILLSAGPLAQAAQSLSYHEEWRPPAGTAGEAEKAFLSAPDLRPRAELGPARAHLFEMGPPEEARDAGATPSVDRTASCFNELARSDRRTRRLRHRSERADGRPNNLARGSPGELESRRSEASPPDEASPEVRHPV
jgi:hypothetical protein